MNDQSKSSYCAPLIGQSLLSLEKKDYSWFFVFSGEVSIDTESFWRFIAGGRIFVTSEDHGHQFALPHPVDATKRVLSHVANRPIIATSIHPVTGDLAVSFNEDIHLQFYQLSCGYESWRLNFRGSQTICIGGGKIVHYKE